MNEERINNLIAEAQDRRNLAIRAIEDICRAYLDMDPLKATSEIRRHVDRITRAELDMDILDMIRFTK